MSSPFNKSYLKGNRLKARVQMSTLLLDTLFNGCKPTCSMSLWQEEFINDLALFPPTSLTKKQFIQLYKFLAKCIAKPEEFNIKEADILTDLGLYIPDAPLAKQIDDLFQSEDSHH